MQFLTTPLLLHLLLINLSSSHPTTPKSTSSSSSSTNSIHFLGRVNPSTRELTWPSTGLSFSFTGTTASIAVTAVTGSNSADLIIDGDDSSPIVIYNVVTGAITTPAGLKHGWHTVELRKRSEAVIGTFVVGDVTTDGRFLPTNSPPRRKIEIVGDSISVGYGLDGTFPCINTAAVEDNPLTYGALAAEAVGADYSVVAWSGKGLIRNYLTDDAPGSPIMPELWTRYGADDADNSYPFPSSATPDAVVINLGTNDFGYVGTNASGDAYDVRPPIDVAVFTAAYVKFVRKIERHYPRARFFLMSSPMLSDSYPTTADAQHTTQVNILKAVVRQVGSWKAEFVDWPTQGAVVGCDYHPDAATHAAEGKVLAAALRAALRW